jgi:hypothetical protein
MIRISDEPTTARTTRCAEHTCVDSLCDTADCASKEVTGKDVGVFTEDLNRFFDNLPTAQHQFNLPENVARLLSRQLTNSILKSPREEEYGGAPGKTKRQGLQ